MTVRDIVSLDTPPKNEAAPIKASAPGSIHFQKGTVGIPPWMSTISLPITLPYKPPINLVKKTEKKSHIIWCLIQLFFYRCKIQKKICNYILPEYNILL